MSNQQLWQAILGHLEVSLSKANFNTWFKNTGIFEHTEDTITIGVPSMYHRDWISNKANKIRTSPAACQGVLRGALATTPQCMREADRRAGASWPTAACSRSTFPVPQQQIAATTLKD